MITGLHKDFIASLQRELDVAQSKEGPLSDKDKEFIQLLKTTIHKLEDPKEETDYFLRGLVWHAYVSMLLIAVICIRKGMRWIKKEESGR